MVSWLFSFLLIFFLALPTLLIVILYQHWVPPTSETGHPQARMRYLLYSVALLSLLLALLALVTGKVNAGPVALAFIPALVGLLAVLLINFPAVKASWQTDRKPVIVALVSFLLALLATTLTSAPSLVLVLVVPPILIALLWALARRLNLSGSILVSAILMVALLLDAFGLTASHAIYASQWLRSLYKIASGLAAILALILAAIYVYRLIKPRPGELRRPVLYASLAILLILCVGAATLRHGTLVEATGRAFEDHLPFTSLAVSLILGLVLALNLNGQARWAGLAFLLVASIAILFFYSLGWQVNPQAITAARAGELEQAIRQYRQETGAYPASLADLSPTYQKIILGPLTGRGQAWCYQSGADYYRLGYVYYQRYHQYPDGTPFWEPYYAIEVPSAAGQPPPGEWICDDELRLFKQHHGL